MAAGLAGEGLLFLRGQSRQAEEFLLGDFRAAAFLKPQTAPGRIKIIEEKLRAMPGVLEARFISSQEALAALHQEEPEVAESAALLGDNPLPPSFAIQLSGDAIARLPHWIEDAYSLGDFSDIRHKPAQARAILQARYYGRFLDLVLSTLGWLAGLLAAGCIALSEGLPRGTEAARALRRGAWTGAGVLCGMAACAALLLPLRGLAPGWTWPSPISQAILVIAVAGISGLCSRS